MTPTHCRDLIKKLTKESRPSLRRSSDQQRTSRAKAQLLHVRNDRANQDLLRRARVLLDTLTGDTAAAARTHCAAYPAQWHAVLHQAGPELVWTCDG